MGTEEVFREVVQAHRSRYARLYRRRWGADPPALRVRRIAFIHAGSPDPETGRRRALLAARGAVLDEWVPGTDAPPPFDYEPHGVFLAIGDAPDDAVHAFLHGPAGRRTERGVVVAAVGPAVIFLARGGLLRGKRAAYPPGEEASMTRLGVLAGGSPVVHDGVFLTCAGSERVPDLIRALLDLIHQPHREGGTET